MSDKLFSCIVSSVFKQEEIQDISTNSQGVSVAWILDFKGESLSRLFLREYALSFWNSVDKKYTGPLQIGGMESGALPLVAALSLLAPEGRETSSFYIRKSRKKSNLANLVEGNIKKDVPIILVDDVLNSGGTILKQVRILEDLGHQVSALFVCVRYRDLSFYQELQEKGIHIFSIFELNDFSKVLPVQNIVFRPEAVMTRKFAIDYRVTLTKKPNLYIVASKSAPLLMGDLVYACVDDGTLFCLKETDGSVVWKYTVPFGTSGKKIFSSPAVYKESIIFGAYDGNVYSLNRFTGKREWVFIEADWIGSSPFIDEEKGRVFIGVEFGLPKKSGGVVCIDIATGSVLWKNYSMEGFTHASPAYNKKSNLVICGCNDFYVYAFNGTTGEIVWKYKTSAELKYGAVFDDKRGLVIIAGLDGGVYALSMRDGSLYHRFEALFGFYSTPILVDNCIIIGSLDKCVYSCNLDTKLIVWKFETRGRIFASPLFSPESHSLFVGGNDGKLYELSAKDGKLLSQTQFSERIVNRVQLKKSIDGKTEIIVLTFIGELIKLKER